VWLAQFVEVELERSVEGIVAIATIDAPALKRAFA